MSTLPTSKEAMKHIIDSATEKFQITFDKRYKSLPAGLHGLHNTDGAVTLIENTVTAISERLNSGDLTSDDSVADFLAKRIRDLTSKPARKELLASIHEGDSDKERKNIVDRICAEDHLAIECVADAMGILQQTTAAFSTLNHSQSPSLSRP